MTDREWLRCYRGPADGYELAVEPGAERATWKGVTYVRRSASEPDYRGGVSFREWMEPENG